MGDVVSCAVVVTNLGSSTELYHLVFSADGTVFDQTRSILIMDGDHQTFNRDFVVTSSGNVNMCVDLVCDTPGNNTSDFIFHSIPIWNISQAPSFNSVYRYINWVSVKLVVGLW